MRESPEQVQDLTGIVVTAEMVERGTRAMRELADEELAGRNVTISEFADACLRAALEGADDR